MPVAAVAENAAEMQREEEARPQAKGGGFFGRKYGPLKGWQWSLAAGGAALVYFYWRSRKKAQAASGTAASYSGSGAAGSGGNLDGQLAALQAEIEALQQQEGSEPGGGGSGPTGPPGPVPIQPVPPHKPGVPGGLKADKVQDHSAHVSWNASQNGSGPVTYEVELTGRGPTVTPAHDHVFVSLHANRTYTWKVRAQSAAGASDWATSTFHTKHLDGRK